MFAESLLEVSWAQRTRRSWMTVTSFGLQAIVIGLLLMIPVLQTVGLPEVRTVSTPISAGRPDPGSAPPPHGAARSGSVQIVPFTGRIMAPGRIPNRIPTGPDTDTAWQSGPVGEPSGYIGPTTSGPGFPFPLTGSRPMPAMPAPPPTRMFRPSSLLEGSLIRRVQPVYPPLAKLAHVQGAVMLAAIISKTGTMERVQLVSGHPMLVPAAVEAVSQWRYKPYILNGEAIEVETQITVNFVLAGN